MIEALPLSVGESAVIHRQFIAEDTLQAGCELGCEGDFRHQIEDILTGSQLALDQMDIHIRFTTGCDSMQEYNLFAFTPETLDFIDTFLLCFR